MKTLLLLLLSGVVSALVIELMARLYVRRSPYRVLAPGRVDRMSLHRETLPTLDEHVLHAVNSHGERGSERPADPRAFRILAAGGSAVSCYMLDQQVAWPHAMERMLQEHPAFAGRPVHVGNIGKSSVDSGTLEIILDRILPQERGLNALLIMVGASDVLRWLALGAPSDRPAEMLKQDEIFERRPDAAFGWHPKRLAVATLYRWRRDAKGQVRSNSGKRYGVARRMRAKAETIVEVPDSSIVLKRFQAKLECTIRNGLQYADSVIVVRQPWFQKDRYSPEELAQFWNGSIGDAYTEECSTFYAPEVVATLCRQVDECAAHVASQLGVASVDVMAHLESSNAMYMDQFHFTPPGSRIVAQAVAEAVIAAVSEKPQQATGAHAEASAA